MKDKEEEEMLSTKQKPQKKPVIRKNKFANLSKEDWKESNDATKTNRGASGLTYQDIYGR
ncbi:hypothetical protein ACQKMV_06500 [Lysinibacillus sp. NPDC094403]|uniref:hypothetical protein n=1 Tax=Lysinibacillus sp. NPDC094403 TaxID=3390581 RepID=UPI003D045C85